MKSLSILVLLICLGVFAAVSAYDYERLPEKMVSRFDGSGAPSSWMAKGAFFQLMVAVGLGVPLLPVGVTYALRFVPPRWVNLPEYWKEPENYPRLCHFAFASSLWYATGFLLLQAALVHLVTEANLATPPQLNSALMLAISLALLILTFAWVIGLLLYSERTDNPPSTVNS